MRRPALAENTMNVGKPTVRGSINQLSVVSPSLPRNFIAYASRAARPMPKPRRIVPGEFPKPVKPVHRLPISFGPPASMPCLTAGR